MSERPRFHLAFPVTDLEAARRFYGEVLGCPEGRSDERWVDFDFWGHQVVAHLGDEEERGPAKNDVDGDEVPVRHFGVILAWDAFDALAEKLRAAGVRFRIEPRLRFAGQPGEQKTLFVDDPSGNVLEFKAFQDDAWVFRT